MAERLTFRPPAISVDVEDWPQSSWDRTLPITARSADNTRRLLELLERAGIHATMFVLGKFAERFPEIVREICTAGHEIACHGYGHVEVFKQTQAEFRKDVRNSKDLLEQSSGIRVIGYRAPDFSIITSTLWALTILAEEGFVYDSSIFPVRSRRYGIPDWPRTPMQISLADNLTIHELPIATVRRFGINVPVGGGGYHRLLPGFLSRYFAQQVMRESPFVFYCHPYEFDALEFAQISLKLPLMVRLHQGLGRAQFTGRFEKFLTQFGGQRMIDLLESTTWGKSGLAEVMSGAR
jgi:polysaccharide deacetylase family protein (PEP-CTERM system associated)